MNEMTKKQIISRIKMRDLNDITSYSLKRRQLNNLRKHTLMGIFNILNILKLQDKMPLDCIKNITNYLK
tara:strand:- start:1603 stop:1809 length:207 start_codon:yes stop_codon:yes gene_type:complete